MRASPGNSTPRMDAASAALVRYRSVMTMTTSSTGRYRTCMKLTLDANPAVTLVRSYSNGELRVGEQVFHRSCILTPEAVVPDWRPTKVEALEARDLDVLFAAKPELVLLGTGDRQ